MFPVFHAPAEHAADDHDTDPGLATDEAPEPTELRPHPNNAPLYEDDRPHDDHEAASPVLDLFTAGHGFSVRTWAPTLHTLFRCEDCQTVIVRPARSWVCEFAGDVTERPEIGPGVVCECNWCLCNLDCRDGRPPEKCTACRLTSEALRVQAYRDKQNEDDRHRAMHVLAVNPDASDKEVANLLGVRVKRVKEARKAVESCTANSL